MDKNDRKITRENAADRITFAGEIFTIGERLQKEKILKELPKKWSDLHINGDIHIHDLDAYGMTYNCLAFVISNSFPYKDVEHYSSIGKIIFLFSYLQEFLTKLGNEQSGGMGFANFDNDIAETIHNMGLSLEDINQEVLRSSIRTFILWCNNSHERLGKVSYYVTLNLGLASNELARVICYTVLDEFSKTSVKTYKPNIVFKVSNAVNARKGTKNYDLFQKALTTTTKKMIPTYVLTDSEPNKLVDPNELVIMGCRTRVVDNKYGKKTSIGRGNITNISINLPRLAYRTIKNGDIDIDVFYSNLSEMFKEVSKILEHRFDMIVRNRTKNDFNLNSEKDIWLKSFKDNSLEDIFINGTLSVGFIGLSETVEVLTGKKFYIDPKSYELSKNIVSKMRTHIDDLTKTTKFNYSLLATSGEQISGRFTELDIKAGYIHPVTDKGYYTNSFHVDVDSGLSTFEKIEKEAPFHLMSNGGCITYLELHEAPINNEKALEELLMFALDKGIHYMGFNYELDYCNDCGHKGLFDSCPKCGSNKITRIRRVSGYLEIVDYFTKGKANEEKNRKRNSLS
ncbi:MAG: anaerobic ribonucleoside-triphosphate reductase [Acholeplasmataceae bacterium]|nr:anaerobic ribonucleoside-triphosphate reductase [Acholeplasmataceae bacterium]